RGHAGGLDRRGEVAPGTRTAAAAGDLRSARSGRAAAFIGTGREPAETGDRTWMKAEISRRRRTEHRSSAASPTTCRRCATKAAPDCRVFYTPNARCKQARMEAFS